MRSNPGTPTLNTLERPLSTDTKSTTALHDPPVPVRAKLAAAWTSFMFLYIYVDYFALYKPGFIDQIRGGVIWEFDISQTLLTAFLAAAWTSFMFLYIYVDYFALYKPGFIDQIRGGVIWEFDISQTLLTAFL